jgi:hypothetical protein
MGMKWSPNGTALIPGVLFVQFQSLAPTELAELVLKRHALVMLLLILNVLRHVLDQRGADRTFTIAGLPAEISSARELAFQPLLVSVFASWTTFIRANRRLSRINAWRWSLTPLIISAGESTLSRKMVAM